MENILKQVKELLSLPKNWKETNLINGEKYYYNIYNPLFTIEYYNNEIYEIINEDKSLYMNTKYKEEYKDTGRINEAYFYLRDPKEIGYKFMRIKYMTTILYEVEIGFNFDNELIEFVAPLQDFYKLNNNTTVKYYYYFKDSISYLLNNFIDYFDDKNGENKIYKKNLKQCIILFDDVFDKANYINKLDESKLQIEIKVNNIDKNDKFVPKVHLYYYFNNNHYKNSMEFYEKEYNKNLLFSYSFNLFYKEYKH